jgi:outer membrane protein assembly factor BamB
MGHLAARDVLVQAWRANIGEGGGYRRKITARPVIADGRVFTMDSDAVVTAFDTGSGRRLWRVDTRAKKSRSTNVGGGLALDNGKLFAATGRGDAVALIPATGKIVWRSTMDNAARAGPTAAEDKLFVPLIDGSLVALKQADGSRAWLYQGVESETEMLGLPSPAYADGTVVAGFGNGDLVALQAPTGALAWSDSLASNAGRNSLIDLPSVRAMPVIDNGQVFAVGVGGLMISLDLRSGRRLWERDVDSGETPWLAGDWLFLLTGEMEAVALNRTDGAVAWVTQLPPYENAKKQTGPIRWIGPTLIGDRLVFAGSVHRAVAVSPYTGKVLGLQNLPAAASVAPVVADGTLYIVTDDATLLALR